MLILLLACLPLDDGDVPSLLPPATGAAWIGAEGGSIERDGVLIEIPAGALPEEVEIRIVDTGEQPPHPYQGLSTVWSFEPDGLVFDVPVTVSIPYEDHTSPRMYWSTAEGYSSIEATFAEGLATATIEHFSTGFVAVIPLETVREVHPYPAADVLFVVDNSCSMYEEQVQLAANAVPMFDVLHQSGLDYHIGVTTTDMNDGFNAGKLRSVSGERFVTPDVVGPLALFNQMVNVGTAGWYEEEGRAAAYSLIELKRDFPRNVGFYRDDASLDLVFLSDEEDQTGGNPVTIGEFRLWMHELKDDPADVGAHAIVGIPSNLCAGIDTPGGQYINYANSTSGQVMDICDADWTPGLTAMVENRLDGARIALPADVQIVEVAFDAGGSPRRVLDATEYSFSADIVWFDQGVRPEAGDEVRVDYRPL